jgi:NADH-quinone oxidoreductase subunit L
MWIGSLALAGIPLFAGYYSKDIIIESAFAAHTGLGQYAFWMGIAAALMTAFYSWRLIFMTFHGKTRAPKEIYDHAHDPGPTMLIPLGVLALGACFAGWLAYEHFVGHDWKMFWEGSILIVPHHQALENAHHVPGWVKLLPLIVGAVGIAIAFILYILFPGWPKALARAFKGIYLFLLNKWYFDELYDRLFVRPAFRIGAFLWKSGDGKMIDGLGPDGISATTLRASRRVAALQTGYLYHYAFAILIGVAVFVTIYLLGWLK